MNAVYRAPKRLLWQRMKAWLVSAILYIKHRQWLQRPALERMGREAARIVKESFLFLVEIADKIQRSGSYLSKASTWDEYTRLTWGISASHLSHFRSAAPYARKLLQEGIGEAPLLEAHLRRLKKHVPLDNPLMPQAYVLGNRVAGSNAPTEAIYRRSLEVLEQAQETGGTVQVGEKTFLITNVNSAVEAVKESLAEAQRVGREGAREAIEVTARFRSDGTWELDAAKPLPKTIRFKVYI